MNAPQDERTGFLSNRIVRALVSCITALLLAVSLIGIGLFTCSADVTTQALSEGFSRWEGSSFTKEQVVEAALATKDYTVGSNDREALISELESIFGLTNTEVLLDAEALGHLDDVFAVVDLARQVIIICMVIAVCLCFLIGFGAGRHSLGVTLRAASLLVIALFSALAVWCIVDFNGFFTVLHSLFFAEGSWLFDVNSLLIRMYPTQFWIGMGVVWLCTSLLSCVICFILGKKIQGKKRL
ncbi:MAG: DUF1461 domain-containing protein [Raoultibacter sp.]|jgi:integral membrane protein (TIGR01906 family)